MKFRIKHLFIATAMVAVFTWVLANPSPSTAIATQLAIWVTTVVLIIRAVTHKTERIVISMGLLASISYLLLVRWELKTSPIRHLVSSVYPQHTPVTRHVNGVSEMFLTQNPNYLSAIAIGESAFAVLCGFLAAGLATYWSRRQHEVS